MTEDVQVVVGGTRYDGWKEVRLSASFRQACRSFTLVIAAEVGAKATNALFAVGTPLQVYLTADLFVDGYINRKRPQFDEKEAVIHVSGRSKGQDLVDCSCMHESGYFENKDAGEIGNAVADGIDAKFEPDGDLEKLDEYQITPGETVFDCVDDLCRDQGKTLSGQPNGNVKITDASKGERHAGAFQEGYNMKGSWSEFSDENRHSETHVRAQHPRGHGDKALRMHAVAMDTGVRRHRPHVHHHHGRVTDKQLQKRAEDRRNRKAGNGTRCGIETPYLRDDAGKLWTPGKRVFVGSDFLDLQQDMLIEDLDVSIQAKGEGEIAALTMVDPQAYNGKAGKASQSGAEWGFDASEAS